jgi:hypothetical protein
MVPIDGLPVRPWMSKHEAQSQGAGRWEKRSNLGIWESLNNPGFKPVEFDGFRRLAGLNSLGGIGGRLSKTDS